MLQGLTKGGPHLTAQNLYVGVCRASARTTTPPRCDGHLRSMRSLLRSCSGFSVAPSGMLRRHRREVRWSSHAESAEATLRTQQQAPTQSVPKTHDGMQQGKLQKAQQNRSRATADGAVPSAGQQLIEERAAELGPSLLSIY